MTASTPGRRGGVNLKFGSIFVFCGLHFSITYYPLPISPSNPIPHKFILNPNSACCWSARRAPARRCWRAPSPARPTCRSSPSPAPTSSRCSSAWAQPRARPVRAGKKNAPCIVFIDEIDAVGRHRGAGLGGGTTSASRRSTSSWSRWTASRPTRRHPDRRHQPSRRARPGAAAPGPFRPPGRRANPRRRRPRGDPQGPHAQGAAGARRRSARDGARHARLLGRRPRQPGQRGGAAGRRARQAPRHHARLRIRQGQGADGRRAALDGHDRRREKRRTAYHEAGHALVGHARAGRPTRCTR